MGVPVSFPENVAGKVDEQQLRQVTTVDELQELVGCPTDSAANKVRTSLHAIDRQWLAASPFALIATSDAQGNLDVSPKGDPPGFTLVLNSRQIAIPDRPGNRRVDGLRNLLTNPKVGLIYVVPGRGDTLRINGRARMIREAPFLDEMVASGHRPQLAILVDVDEVFYHCSKAFLRSALWLPNTWNDGEVPSRARIAHALERPDTSLAELETYYGPDYAQRLYG